MFPCARPAPVPSLLGHHTQCEEKQVWNRAAEEPASRKPRHPIAGAWGVEWGRPWTRDDILCAVASRGSACATGHRSHSSVPAVHGDACFGRLRLREPTASPHLSAVADWLHRFLRHRRETRGRRYWFCCCAVGSGIGSSTMRQEGFEGSGIGRSAGERRSPHIREILKRSENVDEG